MTVMRGADSAGTPRKGGGGLGSRDAAGHFLLPVARHPGTVSISESLYLLNGYGLGVLVKWSLKKVR